MSSKKRYSSDEKSSLLVWLEFVPFWVLYQIIRLIPLKLAYFISRQLFKALFLVDKRHRNRAIDHLAHTSVAGNRHEAVKMVKESYLNFSMLLVEIFKMDQLLKVEEVTTVGSEDSIRRACNTDGGNIPVIIVTAHYGNWELAGSTWAEKFKIPMVSIMRRFGNPLIGEYILSNRASDIHECVPKEGGIKGALKALKSGKTVAILADQHANSKEGVETTFFNEPCRTHMSPALLHLKTGIPILPQLTRRVDNNFNFEFIVGDLIEYTPTGDKEKDIQVVTQMFTSALEELISKDPTQWLWAHRRWLNINRGTYKK